MSGKQMTERVYESNAQLKGVQAGFAWDYCVETKKTFNKVSLKLKVIVVKCVNEEERIDFAIVSNGAMYVYAFIELILPGNNGVVNSKVPLQVVWMSFQWLLADLGKLLMMVGSQK